MANVKRETTAKGIDKAKFKENAQKTKKANVNTKIMRGGTRL